MSPGRRRRSRRLLGRRPRCERRRLPGPRSVNDGIPSAQAPPRTGSPELPPVARPYAWPRFELPGNLADRRPRSAL